MPNLSAIALNRSSYLPNMDQILGLATKFFLPAGRRGTKRTGRAPAEDRNFESHKLELATPDRRGRRGCSSRYRAASADFSLAGSDRAIVGAAGVGRRVFFSRTAERPHLRSGCVEPPSIGTALCVTSTGLAGARSGAASRRANRAVGRSDFRKRTSSHGQFLNRWQLLHIANVLDGPAAVVGDYNAIGPIKLAGFEDIGPRQPTHSPNNTISLRLHRCMARGLRCSYAKVLARGRSDHHPIRLDLHVLPAVRGSDRTGTIHVRRLKLRDSVERWARTMSDAPNRIRVRQTFFETLDVKLKKGKRGKTKGKVPRPQATINWRDSASTRLRDTEACGAVKRT